MKAFLAAIVLAGLLTGCATAGTPFSWDAARQLKVGMSTSEAITAMGNPYLVRSENGVLRYVWVDVSLFTHGTRSISVDFVDGKIKTVPPIPEGF